MIRLARPLASGLVRHLWIRVSEINNHTECFLSQEPSSITKPTPANLDLANVHFCMDAVLESKSDIGA